MRRRLGEAADRARAAVIDGVRRARDVLRVAGPLGEWNRIVLEVAQQNLRAGADVVSRVPAHALHVVEAAPDALVDLHDADARCLAAQVAHLAAAHDVLAPAALDERSGWYEVPVDAFMRGRELGARELACRGLAEQAADTSFVGG